VIGMADRGQPRIVEQMRVAIALLVCACSSSSVPTANPTAESAISRPSIVAHRGASHDAPENTMPAFRRAWELGVECVELDVHLSKDGETVVIHDDTTKRIGGRDKPVAEQTLAELRELDMGGWKNRQFAGEKIPTLGDVMRALPAGRAVFVEIKTAPATAPAIAQAIRDADPRPRGGSVLLQGIEADSLAALAKELPWAPAYWDPMPPMDDSDPEHVKIFPYTLDVVREAKQRGFAGLALMAEAVTDEVLAAAKAAGLEMDVWTLNTTDAIVAWQAKGVRWVETDRPDLAPIR
jgi:glycerophosphoryl diester phosphodiesterase